MRSLPGSDTRPTADRLRETLFNVLSPGNPDALAHTVWADLYAGTGAVGIEALSRGASKVYFVESSAAAVRTIRENLASLNVSDGFELVQGDVLKALRRIEAQSLALDYVFLDPPYQDHKAYVRCLTHLGPSSLLKNDSVVIAEHVKKFDPGEVFGAMRRYRTLVQGDAALSFYRRS